MLCWIKFPLIVSLFLFSWIVVAVSSFVHFMNLRVFANMGSSHWIYHFFGTFKARSWYTKSNGAAMSLFRPLITSSEAFTQWLSCVRCIFIFFNVIELISKT